MPSKSQSIIVGALVYALLGLAINFLFVGTTIGAVLGCLVAFSGGTIAVWHYTSTHSLTLEAGKGAGMGALAGLGGAFVASALALLFISLGLMPEPMEAVRQQFIDQGMTGEQLDQSLAMAENFSNPIISLVIGSVVGALLGAISGAISALVFKKGGDSEAV